MIALYSVRSERAFCEELEYNLLYRWFLDMDLMERGFDATVFTKNRQRLLSDEHFSVDGTLIEAAANLKNFRSKEGPPPPTDDDPGNPSVDFRGSAAATRRTPAPWIPRRACCARARGRKPGWPSWAMP